LAFVVYIYIYKFNTYMQYIIYTAYILYIYCIYPVIWKEKKIKLNQITQESGSQQNVGINKSIYFSLRF